MMTLKREIAMELGVAGLSIALAAAGCTPDCVSKEDADKALLDRDRAGLLKCPYEPACDPAAIIGRGVDDECGVFVSAGGSDTADGTKAAPVKTIKKAQDLLSSVTSTPRVANPAIYLCAESFQEDDVTLGVKSKVYGKLNCKAEGVAAWAYVVDGSTVETLLTASEGKIPLHIKGGDILIHDVHVRAASVTALKLLGSSSIAVVAEDATATFFNSFLEAGDGAPGKAGESYEHPAADGMNGSDGNPSCSKSEPTVAGGAATINKCQTGTEDSVGGDGGPGYLDSGYSGVPGSPLVSMNEGVGEAGENACQPGKVGQSGAPGASGVDASERGDLNWMVGYIGVPGGDGSPGNPGQGGGGGGGSRATALDCKNQIGGGASGGSGASGGCGGDGGPGGGPGGSSIGVVSINSKLTFSSTSIRVGKGGSPGAGGEGQSGGVGGAIGGKGGSATMSEIKPGCAGARGGDGGAGGRGGKGLGGHAIGVAYKGTAPTVDEGAIAIEGDAGDKNAIKATTQSF